METKSIGKIKLNQFETSHRLAEIKVAYKRTGSTKHNVTILNSKDSFDILYPLFNKDVIGFLEEFYVLLLNRANAILGWVKLSSGGTAGTVVDKKIIAIIALQTNASGIILCHNHPTGNIKPSEHDIQITETIKDACQLLEIRLLDHLIISPIGVYFSFSDEGVLS
jgi:DNA repair protein RadC